MNVQPSLLNVPTVEGSGRGSSGDNGSDGGTESGDDSIDAGIAGNGEVEVCIELETGNLQRNVTLTAVTFSSSTSTGR